MSRSKEDAHACVPFTQEVTFSIFRAQYEPAMRRTIAYEPQEIFRCRMESATSSCLSFDCVNQLVETTLLCREQHHSAQRSFQQGLYLPAQFFAVFGSPIFACPFFCATPWTVLCTVIRITSYRSARLLGCTVSAFQRNLLQYVAVV